MKPLIIGTRGSPLALAQTYHIRDLLMAAWPGLTLRVRIIRTSGDLFPTASLVPAGGKGLFTKEIEDQLLAGTVDLAVHSLKDLPTTLPEGLILGATPAREDVRDVLISKKPVTLATLPAGATVATSSLRRRAQLLAARPDLHVVDIRGNLDTRLRKLGENADWSATILAAAGLNRLGIRAHWPDYVFQPLPVAEMLPAIGQGAIGIEIRADDHHTRARVAAINDPDTWAAVTAERAFLQAIGGGCQLPYGAYAMLQRDQLQLRAARFQSNGSAVRTEISGPVSDAEQLGIQAARQLSS